MKLMTKAIEKKLAKYPLYSQSNVPANDKYVICKFFNPCGLGTWYVTEGNQLENGDWEFFGLVDLHETEWGYFTLSQLESVSLPFGLTIERDLCFDNKIDSATLYKL